MVSRNIYVSITIIGIVFTILTLLTEQSSEIAITILYLTLVANLLLKLIVEWKYFRSYNAPLASVTFVLIPTIIALCGSFITHSASLGGNNDIGRPIISININIEALAENNYLLLLNIFSILFVFPFFAFLFYLLSQYYSKRYPSTFINRKKFPRELMVLYNILIIFILIIIWSETSYIEISSLFFSLGSILLFFKYYILRVITIPFQRTPYVNRNYHQSSRYTRRPQSSSNTIRTSSNVRRSDTQTNRPVISSQESRNIVRSTESIIPITSSINVVDGVNADIKPIKRIDKLSPAIVSSLTPVGQHLSKDDFRCIFCYEFPIEKEKKVVICPFCGHPAHDHELRKWLAVADICSRCNKPIAKVKMARVTGSSYNKIIQMFDNNELSPKTR